MIIDNVSVVDDSTIRTMATTSKTPEKPRVN
jgi:predicted hotdog family 3-hydroxylacyl-ACP dehydratase